MKISKNILTSALAVVVAFSVIMGTLVYAYRYTSTHAEKNNSFQRGDGQMPQGGFKGKDGNNFQGGAPNGDFKKPGN